MAAFNGCSEAVQRTRNDHLARPKFNTKCRQFQTQFMLPSCMLAVRNLTPLYRAQWYVFLLPVYDTVLLYRYKHVCVYQSRYCVIQLSQC